MNNIKAFCSWSGGKDSALALYKARNMGIEVPYLLNMSAEDGKFSRSHRISSAVIKSQAECLGARLIQGQAGWDEYESEFKRVVTRLKEEGINAGIFGDIDVEPHLEWIKRACCDLAIKPILPLWGMKRKDVLKDFFYAGFEAFVCVTKADVMGEEWLGRQVDDGFIDELKKAGNIDLCGENGEFHTFVSNGKMFSKPVTINSKDKKLNGNHWFLEVS